MKKILLITMLILFTTTCASFTIHASEILSLIDEMVETDAADNFLAHDLDHILHSATHVAQVTLNDQIYRLNVGDQVLLKTFDQKPFLFEIESSRTDINGTYICRGKSTNGHIIISNSDGVVLVNFSHYDERTEYMIQYEDSADAYYLYEILKNSNVLPEREHLTIPDIKGNIKLPTTFNADEFVTIDVMVVYTPAAVSYVGNSIPKMNNVIATALENAQLSLDNSKINMSLNLVHSALVSYTESGNDSLTDLYKLTFSNEWDPWNYDPNGEMDEVHSWRDVYDADLVVLFTKTTDVGGFGWIFNVGYGAPNWGFSITRIQQASNTYTMIHEIGHNMGAHHRKNQVVQPGPGLYPYSAGWRWIGTNGGKFASVMSYEEDNYHRVPYFSSPNIFYQGVATGTVNDDNARTLNETKGAVAAYRDHVSPTLISASVNSTMIELVYDDLLKVDSLQASAYTVTTTGVETTVIDASISSNNKITLYLSERVFANDIVHLDYNAAKSPIQDYSGNQASRFSHEFVTNLSPAFTIDVISNDSFLIGKDVYYRWSSGYRYENVMKSIEETGSTIYYKYNGRWYDIVNNPNIQSTADYVEANAVPDAIAHSWELRKWYQ